MFHNSLKGMHHYRNSADNLSVSVWLNPCLTLHLVWMIFLSIADKYNACSVVFSTCTSFSLAAHYRCSVRGHGLFRSAALCYNVVVLYKRTYSVTFSQKSIENKLKGSVAHEANNSFTKYNYSVLKP